MFIRLFLIVILFPLQSCSNTLIGEKLENSFDIVEETTTVEQKTNRPKKLNEIKKIQSSKKDSKKENEIDLGNIAKENLIANKDRYSQKSTKSKTTINFDPQPYRIIIRLSGANPSAPAETVTKVLRKAGVKFEVEKIERFDDKNLSKDTSLKR